jgi:AcrR family transcriptional regulator
MGRRRQVSDEQISLAAREVFLDRGPKAPVAMVAKKLGVSTATLFQRTGSKQQLMLMALQPETTAIRELDRGVLTDTPIRDQLTRILVEVNEYLGTIIGGSITLRAARIEHELPEPTPFKVRALLADWLMQADAAKLLEVVDSRITAEVLIGTLEARHIHTYMQQQQVSSKQHRLAARRCVPRTTLASRCFAAVLQRRRSPRGPIATF